MSPILPPSKSLKDVLAKYSQNEFNLLYPSVSDFQVPPIFEIIEEVVKIDPDPKHQEIFDTGQSYPEGENWIQKFGLSKTALEKLSYAAGIVFDSVETGQVPTDNPKKIQFKVQGALQKLDGSYVRATKSKTIDLVEVEKEQRARLEAKALKGELYRGKKDIKNRLQAGTQECKDYIEGEVKLYMIKETKDAPQKAESGAYNRVIRSLLGLKPYYTIADLRKPFVVIRVALNAAALMMDKSTRQAVLMTALQAQTNIFGRLPEPTTSTKLLNANIEIMDADPEEEETQPQQPESSGSQQPASGGKKELSPEEIEKENIEHWTAAPDHARLAEIERLLKAKNYVPRATSLQDPSKLSVSDQVKYIIFLTKQPNPAEKMDWDK